VSSVVLLYTSLASARQFLFFLLFFECFVLVLLSDFRLVPAS